MQGITREMNFSESTFVFPSKVEKCIRKVRIFTPGLEIPFAGHPTLGTAYVLRKKGIISSTEKKSVLELGIGPIEVKFQDDNHIQMFQQTPQFLETFQDKSVIANILGVSSEVISDDWPMQFVSTGFPYLIVPFTSLTKLREIQLNVGLLLETLKDYPARALVGLTAETVHTNSHAHVRMFAPSEGVFEDPATGSAAGPIGAYLEANNILVNHSKGDKIILEQGYEIHRPSKLIVECKYQNENFDKIVVGGTVKTTAEGKFIL
jgi:trans-2,3-dihydro-3-hydroxyanthranilate isomerase